MKKKDNKIAHRIESMESAQPMPGLTSRAKRWIADFGNASTKVVEIRMFAPPIIRISSSATFLEIRSATTIVASWLTTMIITTVDTLASCALPLTAL